MKVLKTLPAIAMVLIVSAPASAQTTTTLRTAPFPGYLMIEGGAHCAVVNGSASVGQATLVLYDAEGNALATNILSVGPKQTKDGTEAFLSLKRPTYCECKVPNAVKWRCAFIYLESTVNSPTVIDAR